MAERRIERDIHVGWAMANDWAGKALPAVKANIFIFVELAAVVITLLHRATRASVYIPRLIAVAAVAAAK